MKLLRMVLAASVAAACGPSFHAIYEGNARFEHCYALEENVQSGMREKADCWRDWSEHYTYGQTRDRIQYATARYVALSQAGNIPTDEALMMAAPGMTPRVQTITAPTPTSALVPPPKVLDEGDAGTVVPTPRPSETLNTTLGQPVDGGPPSSTTQTAPGPAPASSPPPPTHRLPRSECVGRCQTSHRECGASEACDRSYSGCMRACFK